MKPTWKTMETNQKPWKTMKLPLVQKTWPLLTGGSNWPFRCLDFCIHVKKWNLSSSWESPSPGNVMSPATARTLPATSIGSILISILIRSGWFSRFSCVTLIYQWHLSLHGKILTSAKGFYFRGDINYGSKFESPTWFASFTASNIGAASNWIDQTCLAN